jgi:outer membrane protein assembly factor BamB
MRKSTATIACLFLIACLLLSPLVHADDWPQWMGPNRDNVWRETQIVERFPATGPPILWRTSIAGGYAGPAVADGKVFLTDFVRTEQARRTTPQGKVIWGTERVLCLNEQDGTLLWQQEYDVGYSIDYPAGPRCTPNYHDGKLYTLGAEGHLICFDAESGDKLWAKHLPQLYGTKTAMWGYAGHPLIDGNQLICVVGGDGSHVVSFDKQNGQELWRALTSSEQGYSPPLIIEAAGVRQLILLYPDAVTSVDPENGQQYWSVPYEADAGSIIMTPVHAGNYIYCGGFNNKHLLIELATARPAAKVVWRNLAKQALSPVNVQPFVDGDVMYGCDQNGLVYCVEIATGKRLWRSGAPLNTKRPLQAGTSFIVRQADRYWMFNERGELLIVRLSRQGLEEIDRAKVIDTSDTAYGRDIVWSAAAYANRRAYVRNGRECVCVDLASGSDGTP